MHSYTHMLILRPCQNVRECPKEAATISLYASHTRLHMSGRVRGTVVLLVFVSNIGGQALDMHFAATVYTSAEWKMKGVYTCNNTILIIPCSCGIDLDLFYTWGNSFVYTSELPLSSRDMWYIIERKIRSIGLSEAVYFPQGTHTNTDGLGDQRLLGTDHLVT